MFIMQELQHVIPTKTNSVFCESVNMANMTKNDLKTICLGDGKGRTVLKDGRDLDAAVTMKLPRGKMGQSRSGGE